MKTVPRLLLLLVFLILFGFLFILVSTSIPSSAADKGKGTHGVVNSLHKTHTDTNVDRQRGEGKDHAKDPETMPNKGFKSVEQLPPSCSQRKHHKQQGKATGNKILGDGLADMDVSEAEADGIEELEGGASGSSLPPPVVRLDHHPLLPLPSSSSENGVNVNNINGANVNLSSDRNFLVTTLDGMLTLVDQSGKEVWSVATGELFSSTISSLQLSENGKWVNLIPSLTGGLYKFDEESLNPMPMNVDSLLHKSFKLSNDVVINGGKEQRTFGIDLRTGRLRYDCGMNGCYTPQLNELEDVNSNAEEPVTLVVKKQLQTVRAVDTLSGMEKWNFSVGTHNIGLTGVTEGCMEEEVKDDGNEAKGVLEFVKVVIPEGRLLSADPESKTLWDKKFSSPIAQAWVLEGGKLTYVDPVKNTPLKEGPLAIYVGKHNQQFYVQESRQVSDKMEKFFGYPHIKTINEKNQPPKIAWKPSFIVNEDVDPDTAVTALSPIVRPTMRPFYVLEHDEIFPSSDSEPDVEEYLDASNTTPIPPKESESEDSESDAESVNNFDELGPIDMINQVVIGSLWFWWREVLGISILTAVILNILLMRPLIRAVRIQTIRDMYRYLRDLANRDQQEGQVVPPNNELLQILPAYNNSNTATTATSNELQIPRPRTLSDSLGSQSPFVELPEQEFLYMSQYLREFEPVQCLGKGGFGVVFEAKKKIDDRNYAVKRIALPNREQARLRVMREVKALAQLDHKNIVRYFNAWIENPPNGWLEKNDPLWTMCKIGSMTPTIEHASDFPSGMTSTTQSQSEVVYRNKTQNRNRKTTLRSSDLDLDVSTPLLEEDSYIVFDEDAVPLNEDFEDESSFLQMHKLDGDCSKKQSQMDTTIDLSESSSVSGSMSAKGFWKKPDLNSVSWDTMSVEKRDKSISFLSLTKNRVIFESEMGEKGDEIEVGEEAHEDENSSIMYLYIQQELCQKRTLREWLRAEHDRDIRTIVTFFGQIVEAVEYVHSKKLIHRDLKPSNIFLAGSSNVEEHVLKIGDFGLATTALAEVGKMSAPQNEDQKTKGQFGQKDNNLTSLVGTQLYMSPEQCRRKPYDYKVDIYSLGIIFFELLVPFQTEMERHDVLSQVRKAKIPSYFRDSYPEENSLIMKMISHNPNHRPDASSISQWVKSHLRNVESYLGEGGDGEWRTAEPITQRSNSSPGHISLSRCGSSSNSNNSANSWSKQPLITVSEGGERREFHKSHSFTFASK